MEPEDSTFPDPSYEERCRLSPELERLRASLQPLPILHRIAFALCCAERLYPAYRGVTCDGGSRDAVRSVLDRLWSHVCGTKTTSSEVHQALIICRAIHLDDSGGGALVRDAADAVDATICILQACDGHSLDRAVSVAQILRNKIDRPLWREMSNDLFYGTDPHGDSEIEARISSHPLMVAERNREAAELRHLYECDVLTSQNVNTLRMLGRSVHGSE